MKVILYCRVSTREQADSGISLETQRTKLEAYASLYDLDVVAVIEDAGESAKSLKRPGLQRALSMLRKGEADGLAVMKLDRLTRSVGDWQRLIDDHFGSRSELFSVADSIDTRTAGGRLVLNVLLSVAQWEREATGERTREALRHKIGNGQRVGKLRFGYELGEDGATLVPNEAEQEAIAWMKTLRSEGLTLRQIAAALTDRGIETKEGRNEWTHTAVNGILQRAA